MTNVQLKLSNFHCFKSDVLLLKQETLTSLPSHVSFYMSLLSSSPSPQRIFKKLTNTKQSLYPLFHQSSLTSILSTIFKLLTPLLPFSNGLTLSFTLSLYKLRTRRNSRMNSHHHHSNSLW